MHPFTQHQQRHHPRRRPGAAVARHDERESADVEAREDVLCQTDVRAAVGEGVQGLVDVDVRRGVDQGAGGAGDFGVVPFAGEVGGDLLHVGMPVDFGVLGAKVLLVGLW